MSLLSSDAWYNFGCCAALTQGNALKQIQASLTAAILSDKSKAGDY